MQFTGGNPRISHRMIRHWYVVRSKIPTAWIPEWEMARVTIIKYSTETGNGWNDQWKSTDALSEKVAQDTQEEYEKRLGSKDYRDSMEISTPNGTGSVEKSQGNLMYESTDFSIPSLLLNLELTRTYNSQSDKEGMLGKGWYDSFHKELYQLGDDLVFQDSDGTYLTYSPQKSRKC